MAEKKETQVNQKKSPGAELLEGGTVQQTLPVSREKTENQNEKTALSETAGDSGQDSGNGMSFAVSVDLNLLNTDISAVLERKKMKEDTTRTAILVLPTDEPKGGMTLAELILEVNGVIKSFTGKEGDVSADQMKESLSNFNLVDLNSISVELRQIFLYYDKLSHGETSETQLEYAINFVIKNKVDPVSDLKFFKFKSLSASIWNTTRPKIMERMTLGSIDELLK